jgi:hypothetical protein
MRLGRCHPPRGRKLRDLDPAIPLVVLDPGELKPEILVEPENRIVGRLRLPLRRLHCEKILQKIVLYHESRQPGGPPRNSELF